MNQRANTGYMYFVLYAMYFVFSYICNCFSSCNSISVKNNITRYILVIWFSLLLLLGNTPMEFIHLFAGHKDTVHHMHKGLVIENKHHHCAFLSLTLTSFINDYQVPYIFFIPAQYFPEHAAIATCYIQRTIVAAALRGPPLA